MSHYLQGKVYRFCVNSPSILCRSSDGAETQQCPRSPNIYLCLIILDLKETQHYKRGGLTKGEWRRHCDNITRVGESQCKASGFFTEMLENEAEVA